MSRAVISLILALGFLAGVVAGMLITRVQAQSTSASAMAVVVATCGAGVTYTAGTFGYLTENTTGQLCVNQ